MNRHQDQVREFHEKFGVDVAVNFQAIRDGEFRSRLLLEECLETTDAIKAGDLTEAIDGLCDLIYVAYGAALTFGVDLEPYFDEVHRSNMEKEGGQRRGDGKIMKPPGWLAPRIDEMLYRGTGTLKP